MSEFHLTEAQSRAVETRGRAVLVSAAAGSGKTRVLTERLMARVLEGEDIDRFLVITFTRAAAAELRGRILTELNRLASERPGDRRLRRQSALLYRAQIGTIDSFCGSVVRENAHRLGISPGFSMLDEERSAALRDRALEEVLERAYERIGEDEGLRTLVDSVGAGRDDRRLADLIRSLYEKLQSRAWPEKWAEEQIAALDTEGMTDAIETKWGRYLLEDAAAEAEYRVSALERAIARMSEPEHAEAFANYIASYSDAASWFRNVARAAQEGWDRAASFAGEEYPKLRPAKKGADEALKESVKTVWDDAKKAVEKLRKRLYGTSAALLAGTAASRPALSALMDLVFELGKEYAVRKRRADACDFSDVEHFCIQLLCEEDGGPTDLARSLSERFAEVMVDEYQDVNAVQEMIFQRVSGEGERLFMVGDVKQSIYRFRLAEPGIFNAKYTAFSETDAGEKILLRENFRSRGAVLDACNAVFRRIMSPALGEIEYNDEASLVQGAEYPETGEVKPELCIVDPASRDDGEPTPDKIRAEAVYVAGRIRSMVESGECVSDGHGGMRPVGFGDIAVLMRAPGTTGAAFRRALTEAGIPVNARQGGAFFSQPEVNFALSMLILADNPRQDVPLIAALRGLPFGFSPDELTAVRAGGHGDLWDALCGRAESDADCARFVSVVRDLRDLAREESTESLLRWLYDRTGLMAACAAMPDGLQRSTNLMQLYEYARRYEDGGSRGLFRFIAWLRAMEEDGIEPSSAAAGNAVQIMSIHKSKGLEFPVVFLVDNSHQWAREGTEQVQCHSELGLGLRMTDSVRAVTWPTLPWRAIHRRTQIEELSEQERVLYVAMSRARERLIMTCVQSGAEEKLATMEFHTDEPLSPRVLAGANSAAQWLMRAASADGGRTIQMTIVTPGEGSEAEPEKPAEHGQAPEEAVRMLEERLSWRYPYEQAVMIPSKLTATEAKKRQAELDPEAASYEHVTHTGNRRFRVPDFGRKDAPLTGAERGTAEHLVMQYIDFSRTGTKEAVEGEIERLRKLGFLNDRQAAAVPPEDILAFFRSEIGRRVLCADRVFREFRFSLLCPAKRWFEASEEEEVLLQGVVDCCIEENGTLTVIDFKTDAEMHPELYTGQLAAYAEAMSRITGMPVRSTILWYLRKKCEAEVPLP